MESGKERNGYHPTNLQNHSETKDISLIDTLLMQSLTCFFQPLFNLTSTSLSPIPNQSHLISKQFLIHVINIQPHIHVTMRFINTFDLVFFTDD